MPRIRYLSNHWSVTLPYVRVADIRKMHLARGWRDIGYNRVILHPDSAELAQLRRTRTPLEWWHLVKQGRDLDDDLFIEQNEVGAHTLYYNSVSVGICTIGHPSYPLHELQRKAIVNTNLLLRNRFQLPLSAIRGHRDFNPTQCPGDEIYALVKQLRNGDFTR